MTVRWLKCKGNVWCDLFKLDLSNEYVKQLEGIYVVWTGDLPKKVLRVGSGYISRELFKIRNELSFQAFKHLGLNVSWAQLSALQRKGALVYLYEELLPSMQKDIPSGIPFKINLPWDPLPEED